VCGFVCEIERGREYVCVCGCMWVGVCFRERKKDKQKYSQRGIQDTEREPEIDTQIEIKLIQIS